MKRAPMREALGQSIEGAVEAVMVLLALVMLGLLLLEYLVPLSPPAAAAVATAQLVIWVIFALQFILQLSLARDRQAYLRRNWLAAVSVLLPPLRVARVARLAYLLRSARLARMLGVVGRSVRALRFSLGRRGFQYVIATTVVVVLASAAGAFAFERDAPAASINTPGEALWWAAATMTTINAPIDPLTLEGRVIGLLLRVYAMAVFGYITAAIAAYFIGRDTSERKGVGEVMTRLDTIDQHLARIEQDLAARGNSPSASSGSPNATPHHPG